MIEIIILIVLLAFVLGFVFGTCYVGRTIHALAFRIVERMYDITDGEIKNIVQDKTFCDHCGLQIGEPESEKIPWVNM